MTKSSKTSQLTTTMNIKKQEKTVVKTTSESKPHLTATPRKSRRISTTSTAANLNLITPQKQQLRRSIFQSSEIIPENVRRVYKIVHKRTGTIGGNGAGGPIYGELVRVVVQIRHFYF